MPCPALDVDGGGTAGTMGDHGLSVPVGADGARHAAAKTVEPEGDFDAAGRRSTLVLHVDNGDGHCLSPSAPQTSVYSYEYAACVQKSSPVGKNSRERKGDVSYSDADDFRRRSGGAGTKRSAGQVVVPT